MKTTFFITLILALNLSMTFASENFPKKPVLKVAETNYQMLLTQSDDNMLEFTLIKAEGDLFKVKLFNADGDRVFVKRIKRNNKSKTSFDISLLPIGEYKIQVEKDGSELYTKQIEKK